MRDELAKSLNEAVKSKDKRRVCTLRLINAAIKDRDIANRGAGKDPVSEDDIRLILAKMVKQREESSKLYQEGGRQDLVDQENEEIAIIQEFLPRQLDDAELEAVVGELIAETGAQSLRDMGRIMGLLKERYRGQADMGKAGALLKARLGG